MVRARFDAAAGDPLPIAKAYAPDLVLVSAGFDAAAGDPLGEMEVSPSMFGRMCRQMMDVADEFAGGQIVLSLEVRERERKRERESE